MKENCKTIYIGGVRYYVSSVDKISGPHRKGARILGQFNPEKHTVRYRKDLKGGTLVTMTHEILHGIDFEYDLGMNEYAIDHISREIIGTLSQLGVIK